MEFVHDWLINQLSLIRLRYPRFVSLSYISQLQALNRSHGPAVIGLRAQIDRKLYKKYIQKVSELTLQSIKVHENIVGITGGDT